MIDYNKLKKANELAEKLIENGYPSLLIQYNFYHGLACDCGHKLSLGILEDKKHNLNKASLDKIIDKLEELTKPQPKYKVGDTVWHVNFEYEACSFEINRVANDETGYSYEHDCIQPEWWLEEQLYPTKQALIESQIEYWQNMLLPENTLDNLIKNNIDENVKSHIKEIEKCVHVSDGKPYLCIPPAHKCKHCGEFYR